MHRPMQYTWAIRHTLEKETEPMALRFLYQPDEQRSLEILFRAGLKKEDRMKKTVTALLMATVLAACGGGGGGGGSGTPLTIDVPNPIRSIEGGISSRSVEGVQISDISRNALDARDSDGNASLLYACQGACRGKDPIIRRLPHINVLDQHEVANALRVDKTDIGFNQYFFGGRERISSQGFTFGNLGVWMEHSVFGELVLFDENRLPNATILYSFGDISEANPSGTAGELVWNGISYIIDKVEIEAGGNAHDLYHIGRVRVDIDDINSPAVDVEITNIMALNSGESRLNPLMWTDIPLSADGIGFEDSGSATTRTIFGTFYGDEHQEVGGIFNRDGLEGAFGAKRTSE